MNNAPDTLDVLHDIFLKEIGDTMAHVYKTKKINVKWWWPHWYLRKKSDDLYNSTVTTLLLRYIAELQDRVTELEIETYHLTSSN